MTLTYEKATESDIERIYSLSNKLIDDYENIESIDYEKVLRWVRKKIEASINDYTAVYADGQRAGYYHFCKNINGEYEIDDLYVFPQFQNLGIGTQIIIKCCAEANDSIMLYVFIKNKRAVSLYKRLCFDIAETVNNSRYIMRRKLN